MVKLLLELVSEFHKEHVLHLFNHYNKFLYRDR